ncbi:MAG TPA: hypothetical protein VMU58_11330 [Gaiellaceae bacterium]|nr:hypothetical protein [Gaiellaceae bacterium]
MTLHLIAEDLDNHAWYEELFVATIADVEAHAANWAAFEQVVNAVETEPAEA